MVHIPADMLARFLSQAMLLKLALAKYFGLNAIQFMTLLLVGETAVGVSVKALRERLAIPGSSLTFTLDSLEKKHLIKRRRSSQDRRQWLLSLTEKGERLYAEMLEKESEAVGPSLVGFTEADTEAFLRISGEISRSSAASAIVLSRGGDIAD